MTVTGRVCCGNFLLKIAAAFFVCSAYVRWFGKNIGKGKKTKKKGLFKMKKILSLFMVITMVLTAMPVSILADGSDTITAYVTVSKYGAFVKDVNGNESVLMPVELSGSSEYTLDDLFTKLHDTYYPEGYVSAQSDYGAYITKFWGDESGNFGYQVNGGTEAVMGLDHQVEDKDYVDVAIYKNWYPDTEAYTKFDRYQAEILVGEDFEITLSEAGYDADWNMVFSACEGATVTVDGAEADIVTDADGKAVLNFVKAGTYVVSATKYKVVKEENVIAIAAPVCVIEVTDPDYITVIHNIVSKYCKNGLVSDENMVWLIADMAVYNELYPQGNSLTSAQKQACLDKIIAEAISTSVPSVLAKDILALRALGYDARNVYSSSSVKYDIVAKLTDVVDGQDASVTNIYTLPYVIIALRQGEGYATDEQTEYLVDFAISSKDSWQNDEWGTDAASAMLLALAPYYDTNSDVKNAIDEAVMLITSAQDETGLIGNAASTGIAITAFSALDIDAKTICSNDKNCIDGLMTQATAELDGFESMENSFSTEQGLRGLLAWQLYETNAEHIMYDFSSYPMNTAYSTVKTYYSSGGGGGGRVNKKDDFDEKVTEELKKDENTEDANNTTETLANKNPDVCVMPIVSPEKTFGDISQHKNRKEIEALAERNIINGKSESSFEPDSTMTRAEFATIIARGLGLPEKSVAVFNDVSTSDWYCQYINIAYSYGIIKGVSETEFNPNGAITRQEAAVMISRAAKLCGMNTEISDEDIRNINSAFTDYTQVADWAECSVAFCYDNNIISDKDIEILPANKIKRAEVAVMLYNMLDMTNLLQEEIE